MGKEEGMEQLERLCEEDFSWQFSMDDFLASCDLAFRLYGEGVLENPPRVERVERRGELDCFCLEMPARWPGRYQACKVIEEYSDVARGTLGERRARVLLEDLERQKRVEIDADYITDMRTGAAGALGVRYLASESVERVGILGSGRIARTLALAVDRLFALKELKVYSRQAENREAFVRRVGPQLRTELRAAADLKDCVQDCDAVLTAVPTPRPILDSTAIEGKVYLVVMGGDSRTRQVAPELLERVGVVVDQLRQAEDSGEFAHARQTGRFNRISLVQDAAGEVLDIGDAACGRIEKGENGPQLIYCTGLAVQDLCAGVMVYEHFLQKGVL
ncbi:MAG: ornithine cyclodeaminase family protein [Gemmatimonadetes bacterium]|jgi:alanine dehydrogenase|nr:ornithine cyclodeaminase family protein [Gemmatimonadota bacterium]